MGCGAFSHAVLDGTSTWHFVSSWTQICSGSPSVSSRLGRTVPGPHQVQEHPRQAGPPPIPNHPTLTRPRPSPTSGSEVLRIRHRRHRVNGLREPPTRWFKDVLHLPVRGLKPEEVAIFADCMSSVDLPMPESHLGNLIRAIVMGTAAGLILAHPSSFGAAMI